MSKHLAWCVDAPAPEDLGCLLRVATALVPAASGPSSTRSRAAETTAGACGIGVAYRDTVPRGYGVRHVDGHGGAPIPPPDAPTKPHRRGREPAGGERGGGHFVCGGAPPPPRPPPPAPGP